MRRPLAVIVLVLAVAAAAPAGCTHDWDAITMGHARDAGADAPDDDDRGSIDDADRADADGVPEDRGPVDDLVDTDDAPAADANTPADAPADAPSFDAPDVPDARPDAAPDAPVDRPVDPCAAVGRASCGGACVDPNTDPRHCGGCGRECPARANASTACRSGACVWTCAPGFRQLPSQDCATFGGATSNDETPAPCGVNPLAGACDCPAGLAAGPTYTIRGRAAAPGSTVFDARLRLCQVPAPVTAGDWGGSYLYRRTTLPLASDCVLGNPYLPSGCGCPAGFTERQNLPVLVGADNRLMDIFVCSRPPAGAQARTYLGAYVVLIGGFVVPSNRGTDCLAPNLLTGRCTCPDGAREVTVRSMAAGYSPTTATLSPTAPTMVHVCMR